MTTSTRSDALMHPRASKVVVDATSLHMTVEDGREIGVPLAWFDWLASASEADRRAFTIVGGGAGIWWESLDDGVSVPQLFGLPEDL